MLELATTELLLIFNPWDGLCHFPGQIWLQYFSSFCLSSPGFNTNCCPCYWSEVTFCRSQLEPPRLLLFIFNLWSLLLPLIMSPQFYTSSLCYSLIFLSSEFTCNNIFFISYYLNPNMWVSIHQGMVSFIHLLHWEINLLSIW